MQYESENLADNSLTRSSPEQNLTPPSPDNAHSKILDVLGKHLEARSLLEKQSSYPRIKLWGAILIKT